MGARRPPILMPLLVASLSSCFTSVITDLFFCGGFKCAGLVHMSLMYCESYTRVAEAPRVRCGTESLIRCLHLRVVRMLLRATALHAVFSDRRGGPRRPPRHRSVAKGARSAKRG